MISLSLISPLHGNALDTIKAAKEGTIPTEGNAAKEEVEEVVEEKQTETKESGNDIQDKKASLKDFFDGSTSKDEISSKSQSLKEQVNGNYTGEGDITSMFANMTNSLNSVTGSIWDIMFSILSIILAPFFALYSIGEVGLVVIWVICVILIFFVPKKLIIFRNAGVWFARIAALYTVIFIIVKYIFK
jgi:uncharacterized membrane protein